MTNKNKADRHKSRTRNSTVCFFTNDTKENLIAQLFVELESSAWSHIKDNWMQFLSEVLVSNAEHMQYLKINWANILDFSQNKAFI